MSNQHDKINLDVKLIISLYETGLSFTKISSMFNVGKNRIKKILIDNNVFIENRDNIKKIFSNDEIEVIKDLYLNKNLSCSDIGKKFSTSREPIQEILRDIGILRKGNSNGVKIILSNDDETNIKNLYLILNKNCEDIANELGLNKNYVNKFLTTVDYRRTKSEATTLTKTGIKLSEKTKLNMKIAQQKLSKSGSRVQTGGVCKFFTINGLKCQGTYEKFYIDYLIENKNILPENGEKIITPFGVYTPDFQLNGVLIEIKSKYTYDVLIGDKISRFTNKIDLTQYKKIKWVNDNISKVDILVVDKRNKKINKIEI